MSEKIKEYIEREAAIELGKKQSCAGIIDGGDFCNISANMLRNIPAADVVEVRHAHWLKPTKIGGRSVDVPHCSYCKEIPCGVDMNTHYCPNCGAKMDGGADDAID